MKFNLKKYCFMGLILLLNISCSPIKDNTSVWTKKHIKKSFPNTNKRLNHDLYQDTLNIQIVKNETLIILDSTIIKFYSEDSDYLEIFENRLFPEYFGYNGSDTTRIMEICCFKYLGFIRTKKSKRKFEFQINHGYIEPTYYYLELTNTNANKKTDLKTFIKGSTLTYMSSGVTRL